LVVILLVLRLATAFREMPAGLEQVEHSLKDSINSTSTPKYCCCKKEECKDGAVGDDEKPAVYHVGKNLCCKRKEWSCGHLFRLFAGYRTTAPNTNYCDVKTALEPDFELRQDLEETQEELEQPNTDVELSKREALPANLTPGSPQHTVHTYCDVTGTASSDVEEDDMEIESMAKSAKVKTQKKRVDIINSLVKELTHNSLDKMAKEIFSIYVCVRWAPSKEFRLLAKNEIETGQLPNKTDVEQLWRGNRFVPLRCSTNVNVYGLTAGEKVTDYSRFEDQMGAISRWLEHEDSEAVSKRLSTMSKHKGANLEADADLFDLPSLAERRKINKCKPKSDTAPLQPGVNLWTASAEEILQDCDSILWLIEKVENWNSAMPFVSFMTPNEKAAKNTKPKDNERALICFGKRVASQLHRREGGNHLLTDQSAVGCHGFWTLEVAGKMIERIIKLWRPPTCQLAEMELDMKMKIMELIAEMNTRLFDALPALLMEEGKTANLKDLPGNKLARAGTGSMNHIQGLLGAVAGAFAGLGGTYRRLGEMLGDTVVKWAVCPLHPELSEEDQHVMDSYLGTEDETARWYAKKAMARFTGESEVLPGEVCGKHDNKLQGLGRCEVCDVAKMRQDIPEPYRKEKFICPTRPMLKAKQQLDILRNKKDLCLMRMTPEQVDRQENWTYHGRHPQWKQYNLTENRPSSDYEIIKVMSFTRSPDTHFKIYRDFAWFGRRCTEAESAATSRWCQKPLVVNEASTAGKVLGATVATLGTAGAMVGAGITGIQKGVEAAGYVGETPPVNKKFSASIGQTIYGLYKATEESAKTKFSSGMKKRYDSLHERIFGEVEAGELMHSTSFQKELDNDFGDSSRRKKYDRYAVVCPCPDFDPNKEFDLKYEWGEKAMMLAMKGDKEFTTKDSLYGKKTGFTVQVQAAAVLRMSKNDEAWVTRYTHVRAAPEGTKFPEWYKTTDPFLNSMVGSSHLTWAKNIDGADIFGFQAAFACGTRLQMHNIEAGSKSGMEALKPFGQCVREGAAANAKMKKAAPWTKFFPDEVVVRVTFTHITTCYHEADTKDQHKPYYKPTEQPLKEGEKPKRNFYEAENSVYQAFKHAAPSCVVLPQDGAVLPKYLKDMRTETNYRGLMVAKGSPKNMLQEVLLDPQELLDELNNLRER